MTDGAVGGDAAADMPVTDSTSAPLEGGVADKASGSPDNYEEGRDGGKDA